VRTSESLVLVDVGAGPVNLSVGDLTDGRYKGDLIGGELLKSLASVDVSADEIDAILITHLHNDHVGWLTLQDGSRTFPNARCVVDRAEWDYWTAAKHRGVPVLFTDAQYEALQASMELVDGPSTVVDGVTTLPTPGHTPGHISCVISSQGASGVVLGDALHTPMELLHPDMSFTFDLDRGVAKQSRALLVDRVSQPDTWFIGGHFANSVFGRRVQGPAGPQLVSVGS
jgi:glyoxylase-like metal-dependent hydrolase (beta-lactamase superfamily II)